MKVTSSNMASVYKSLSEEQKKEFLKLIMLEDFSDSDVLEGMDDAVKEQDEASIFMFTDALSEILAKAPKTETKPEPKQEPKEEPKKETKTAVEKEVKEVKTEKEEKEKPKKAKSVDVSDWEEEIEKVKAEKEKAKAEKAKKPKKVVIDDDFSELDEIDKEGKEKESVEDDFSELDAIDKAEKSKKGRKPKKIVLDDDFSELDAIDEVKTKRRGRPRKNETASVPATQKAKAEKAEKVAETKIVEKVVEKVGKGANGKERKAISKFLKVMSDELAKLSAVFAEQE